MGLVNVKSKKSRIKYGGDFPNGRWWKDEYNDKGHVIYYENSDGEWIKRKFNEKGKSIYYEDSKGYWEKQEYDENNNAIYYENSSGEIMGRRK